MEYSLKDKIKVTDEFLNELIAKNWQEAEALQQQIVNIDTGSQLGLEVAKVLKNTCTAYYVLIGCLENLAEGDLPQHKAVATDEHDEVLTEPEAETAKNSFVESEPSATQEPNTDFEPFEYFVDFDEPSGEPLTDKDLYN